MTKYIIEQKLTAFTNQYLVFAIDANGQKELVSFAQQKRLAFREEVVFYTSEDKKEESFRIKAENVMDIHGKFVVSDAKGSKVGMIQKKFGSSLIRSTWEILALDGQSVAVVTEKNIYLAVFRRIWGLIPYLGDLPFIFKYHFVFLDPSDKALLAEYTKTTRFRDHYELSLEDNALIEQVGWQTLAAQAVLLDALQGR